MLLYRSRSRWLSFYKHLNSRLSFKLKKQTLLENWSWSQASILALPNRSFCCVFFSFNTKFLHSSLPRKSYLRDPSVRIFWVISKTLASPSKILKFHRDCREKREHTPGSVLSWLLSFPGYNPLNPPGKILQYFVFLCHPQLQWSGQSWWERRSHHFWKGRNSMYFNLKDGQWRDRAM